MQQKEDSSMGVITQEKGKAEKLWLDTREFILSTKFSHQLISDIYCRSLESTIQELLKAPEILD